MDKKLKKIHSNEKIIVEPGKKFSFKDFNPDYTAGLKDEKEGLKILKKDVSKLATVQDKLYAQDRYSVLIIFQAMDAAGKDGTIKHVMSGVNPTGCQIFSFKQPSAEDLDHDYLWRAYKCLPERGRIGIFNRSYYEELIVTKVHPEFLLKQKLPNVYTLEDVNKSFWKQRYEQINNFEKYLTENGTIILKFFLNVSKGEQKKRFLDRIAEPEKNWKFSAFDVQERQFWDQYQDAFKDCFDHTSTKSAPWYIIPANNKWFMRMTVAKIIIERIKQLDLQYPEVGEEKLKELQKAKEMLESEPE
jgi:PPK2 family polyphosphate:nucleotide phosphotransferase